MKTVRQQKILEIIEKYEIETQQELAHYLEKEGFSVTQATISRDIRELKLKKKMGSHKNLIYSLQTQPKQVPQPKYIRVLQDSFISMDTAMNLLVIKTVSGMAMAAAAALDSCNFHEVLGCIAGDDTIMCAARSVQDAVILKKNIEKIME